MRLLSVSRRTLLLIACAVWFVAGFNIVRLGVLAYANVGVSSFVIMACMMTGGIAIRSLHLAPEPFIAVFYTGLGCALALAGLLFGRNWLRFGEAELA